MRLIEASRLHLPNVALVAVTSVAIDATSRALMECLARVEFGQVLFFSDQRPPADMQHLVEWRRIEPILSRDDYSHFILHELHQHVTMNHAICVQWDGYILNADCWDERFLDYDYIGAPWPHFDDDMCVGNGGFSLRSLKLLQASATLPRNERIAEDIALCRVHRTHLEQEFGLIFAPLDVAREFAFERSPVTTPTFGFHGAFNMARMLDGRTMARLISHLEINIPNKREHHELLKIAFKRRLWKLLFVISRRIWKLRH